MSWSRPIVGTTPTGTGITYIVMNKYDSRSNIQVVANGTVTFTVDTTLDTIHFDDETDPVPVNFQNLSADHVAPASAEWINLVASGSADAQSQINYPIAAVRLNITAGTGSVTYRIQQT